MKWNSQFLRIRYPSTRRSLRTFFTLQSTRGWRKLMWWLWWRWRNEEHKGQRRTTMSWYTTERGWKRKKSSIYLRQHIHEQLVKVAEKNQFSLSETWNFSKQITPLHSPSTTACPDWSLEWYSSHDSSMLLNGYVPTCDRVHARPHNQLSDEGKWWFSSWRISPLYLSKNPIWICSFLWIPTEGLL